MFTEFMKPSSILGAMILGVLVVCGIGNCRGENPVTNHAKAMEIVKRLIERDTQHPILKDLRLSRDKKADAKLREESAARTQINGEDFAKLRLLIEPGRPFADYSPIEKLGHFIGKDPFRFFLCGLTGFVNEQGPEPFSIMIDLDSANMITKVGPIVAAH